MKELTIAWNFLKGKKTYLVSLAAFAYGLGIKQGYWPHEIWADILFGATATATVRHGIGSASDPASVVATAEQPTKLASPKDS